MALEVGSGTGQHVIHFARQFPGLVWQPSDYDQVAIASIESYRHEARLSNVREPLLLEVRKKVWGNGQVDVVLAINLVHLTSWSVCEGLFDGARRHLRSSGVLFIYGPFKQNGGFASNEDAELDAALRSRNADWGLRDIEAVVAAAKATGCDALHPGYGFLSENTQLARRCAEQGIIFVGPSPEALDLFGDKAKAKALAKETGVPIIEGTSGPTTLDDAKAFFASLG